METPFPWSDEKKAKKMKTELDSWTTVDILSVELLHLLVEQISSLPHSKNVVFFSKRKSENRVDVLSN